MDTHDLRLLANRIRRRDLQAVYEAGAGHIGGEMSVTDLLTALYFHTMKVDPAAPLDPNRDRLILSKGHTALALYVVLSEKGFLPKEEIATFLQHNSRLNGHPNRVKVPGVETNTGPLGHGLPVGVGMAKAAKLDGADWRTFVITGDGEMQEGSNWEAIMAATHFGLDNLTLIIDHNRLQQGARLEDTNNLAPLPPKLAAFGWTVLEIDGHDMDQITAALSADNIASGKPTCIVAHTNKGHGISFMSDNVAWHHKVPNEAQYKQAMQELENAQMTAPFQNAKLHDCRDAFTAALEELAAADGNIVAVCNDSVGSSKLTGFRDKFPERLINVGIAEQNMVGVGAGLANGGKIPFVCAASPFLTGRALEQIKADVAYSQTNVKLVGISSGMAYGELGPTHHSIEDFAWVRALPHVPVIAPADRIETDAVIRWAATHQGGCFLRLSRVGVPDLLPESHVFELGRANVLCEGSDVTIIANGVLSHRAVTAAAVLESQGISARVLNMATVRPIDQDAILSAARETGAILTCEEHTTFGGLGSAVAEVIVDHHPVPMTRLGVPGVFAHTASAEQLLDDFGMSPQAIADSAVALIRRKG